MKPILEMIEDLDAEIARVKLMANTNGYHHGTAQNVIIRRYRAELKALRRLMMDDREADKITNYSDLP